MNTVDSSLFVHRGPAGAQMNTLGCEFLTDKNRSYKLTARGIEPSSSQIGSIDLEEVAARASSVIAPPHLEIEAIWDKTPFASGSGNNILGDNGQLILEPKTLEIPLVKATEETLAYYGAIALKPGDVFSFPDSGYPIFKMSVDPDYVERFIMTPEGDGFYLEYHADKPHLHMPIQGGGAYLLAKWNEEKTKLHITGFQIPDGEAVYTKKGAIHCDAALTGDLLVGYTQSDHPSNSEHCSTVLLRTKEGEMTKIHFSEAIS
jgi:hypothetical protein